MWGFISNSEDGFNQIDGTYKNVAYVGKVLVNLGPVGVGTVFATVDAPVHDFAFFGDTEGVYVTILSSQQTGNGRTLTVAASAAGSVTIYFYRRQTPTLGQMGIHVWDSSGEIAFSSDDNHLSVLGFVNWPVNLITASYSVPNQNQKVTMALAPIPSFRGVMQQQGQILIMLYFHYRAIRVNGAARQVDLGVVQIMRGVTNWADGHAWSFPPAFSTGVQIIVAGHYGIT